ncbi:MAG: T9SS type A sorting domain-containing protein [Lewinellaceae bacterium]|nr:T9SS type A sorting domain-containing protein [Lewinellaceae bacterium]
MKNFHSHIFFPIRLVLGVLLVFLFANGVKCQTFFPLPQALLEQEVYPDLANECFIYLENPGGDTLKLRWRFMEGNIPEGWDSDMCDYGACYIGIPTNSGMNPVYDSIQGYLKLIVQPGSVSGAAWLWFRVHEENNNSNFQDVYFSLHTPGVSAVLEPKKSAIAIWPNPASSWCAVRNNSPYDSPVQLFSADGQLVAQRLLSAFGTEVISLENMNAGLYWLRSNGVSRQFIIIR